MSLIFISNLKNIIFTIIGLITSTMSKVSVITASFNSDATLEDCIHSVFGQTEVVEHILIDGGSTDSTAMVVEKNRASLSKVSMEPDRGMYDALNKGIGRADRGIIGLLHADDIYADEQVIESVVDAFSDPAVEAVYGDLEYVERDSPDKIVRRWQAGTFEPRRFYHGWMPPHPTFFVRRKLYDQFGLYRLDMGSAADYELMLRFLLVHGVKVQYIPRVLVKMRIGGVSNASLLARLRANRMDRKAWKVNGLRPYPWTIIAKPARKLGQWRAR